MGMLLAEATPNFFEKYGLLIILVVAVVGMLVLNYFRQRKYAQQEAEMQETIKIGTKIKTYAGIYGTVVGIYETTDGKVAKISLDGKSTMEIDFKSIYVVDQKKEVKEDVEVKAEEVKVEEVKSSEEKADDAIVVEAPKAEEKKTTRKTKKAE